MLETAHQGLLMYAVYYTNLVYPNESTHQIVDYPGGTKQVHCLSTSSLGAPIHHWYATSCHGFLHELKFSGSDFGVASDFGASKGASV